jgi:hypothetical protein
MTDTTLVHEPGKIPGIKVMLGAEQIIVPPLNVTGLELHGDTITRAQNDKTLSPREKVTLLCDIILSAVRRNYPDMSIETLKDGLDLANIVPTFHAVMAISGYTEAPVLPGEAKRAKSTGRTSTPALSPQPAGHGNTSAST